MKKIIQSNKLIFRKLSTHFFLFVASFTQGPPIFSTLGAVSGIRLQQAAQDLLWEHRDLELRLETMLGKSNKHILPNGGLKVIY